jgi:hypothetical protein
VTKKRNFENFQVAGRSGQASPGQPGTVRDKIQMSKNRHAGGKIPPAAGQAFPQWPSADGRGDEHDVFLTYRYFFVKRIF